MPTITYSEAEYKKLEAVYETTVNSILGISSIKSDNVRLKEFDNYASILRNSKESLDTSDEDIDDYPLGNGYCSAFD